MVYIGFNNKNVGSRRSYFQSQMSRLAKLLLADQVTEAISHAKEKFPNLDLRYALSSSSYSMKADALYEITSRNKATFEEMRRISNLQTNLNPAFKPWPYWPSNSCAHQHQPKAWGSYG